MWKPLYNRALAQSTFFKLNRPFLNDFSAETFSVRYGEPIPTSNFKKALTSQYQVYADVKLDNYEKFKPGTNFVAAFPRPLHDELSQTSHLMNSFSLLVSMIRK